MSITLQGTVAFEPEFVGQLSQLSRTLLDAGFDPAAFAISKHRAGSAGDGDAPGYAYTVFLDADHFGVSAPDDARFLEFLLARIADGAHDPTPLAGPPGLFARVARWMATAQ